ncbi:hypothetical protein LQZ21_10460 [Treponema sp. TIM-1]|uniref:hypothetical protein n=1 Tax=Treponema sp. TIM-1 TaxID=2898417 RepID=UPI003980B203
MSAAMNETAVPGMKPATIFTMTGLVISGIMMSPLRQFFDFFPLDVAWTIHHLLAYWGFILTSIHIGMYVKTMMGIMRMNNLALKGGVLHPRVPIKTL